jgi:hypothetical protein
MTHFAQTFEFSKTAPTDSKFQQTIQTREEHIVRKFEVSWFTRSFTARRVCVLSRPPKNDSFCPSGNAQDKGAA